jgi:VanZ family protein
MKKPVFSIIYLVPMIVIMGIIFFLSHQPGDSFYIPPIPGLDKIAHMAIYALLAAAVLYALYPLLTDKKKVRVSLLTISICILYGIGDEFHQSFVPGRFVSFADIAADAMGAVAVCVAWFIWRRKGEEEAAKIKTLQSPHP